MSFKQENNLRFVYHANASGVGGRITRIKRKNQFPLFWEHHEDVDLIIPVQGSSSVPVRGGLSVSTTGPYKYVIEQPHPKKILSVEAVMTRALGGLGPQDEYSSESESHFWDLNILDRIKVRYGAVRMQSSYLGRDPFKDPVPELRPTFAAIEGLTLDNFHIPVTIDWQPYQEFPTHRRFFENLPRFIGEREDDRNQFAMTPSRAKAIAAFLQRPKPNATASEEGPPVNYVSSVVKSIDLPDRRPDSIRPGSRPWSVYLDNVGEVFLGEVVMDKEARRICMLRVALGCDFDGYVCGGESQGNSSPTNRASS
jgi:hypothetical protein